jgi:hypothetical protein
VTSHLRAVGAVPVAGRKAARFAPHVPRPVRRVAIGGAGAGHAFAEVSVRAGRARRGTTLALPQPEPERAARPRDTRPSRRQPSRAHQGGQVPARDAGSDPAAGRDAGGGSRPRSREPAARSALGRRLRRRKRDRHDRRRSERLHHPRRDASAERRRPDGEREGGRAPARRRSRRCTTRGERSVLRRCLARPDRIHVRRPAQPDLRSNELWGALYDLTFKSDSEEPSDCDLTSITENVVVQVATGAFGAGTTQSAFKGPRPSRSTGSALGGSMRTPRAPTSAEARRRPGPSTTSSSASRATAPGSGMTAPPGRRSRSRASRSCTG